MFMIARRQVDVGGVNQELMYMSLKFINNIWVLVEVKAAPGSTTVGVRIPFFEKKNINYLSFSAACSKDLGYGCDSWSVGGFQVYSACLARNLNY